MTKTPGERLKKAILAAYELSPSEQLILEEAAAVADALGKVNEAVARLDSVEATGSRGQVVEHPLLASQRAHGLTLARLLAELALPLPGEVEGDGPRTLAARRAARARWDREKGAANG